MENQMFCYQCQESAEVGSCMIHGICGKDAATSAMQDLLLYATKGLSFITTRLRKENKVVGCGINHLITENLAATATNTNFNKGNIALRISETVIAKESLLPQLKDKQDLEKMWASGKAPWRVWNHKGF